MSFSTARKKALLRENFIVRMTNTYIYILFLREESFRQLQMDSYLPDDSGDGSTPRQTRAYGILFFMMIMCCGPSCGLWLCVCALNRGCAKNIQKTTST